MTDREQTTNTIFQRLKTAYGLPLMAKDVDLARVLNTSSQTVSGWRQRNSVPLEKCVEIADEKGVLIDWLLGSTGDDDKPIFRSHLDFSEKGTQPVGNSDGSAAYKEWDRSARMGSPDPILPTGMGSNSDTEFAFIPQRDVDLSAGPGAFSEHEPEIGRLAFRRDWLNKLGVKPQTCVLVRVRGDSMEPTLRDGALVLVNTENGQGAQDGIYALLLDGALVVKRLQRAFAGGLIVHSDNPAYRDIELTPGQASELRVIGRVLWAAAEI